MQKYSCIIVEDEPLAAEVLQDYIRQVPWLNLKKTCSDAISALEFLRKEKVDLVFLDIHLPKLKGFDFIKMLQPAPKIIITSAYHQYALKSYEYDVADYLLKPIAFDRFLLSVNKSIGKETVALESKAATSKERPSMFFKVNKKNTKLFLDEIIYIESQREYIKIYAQEKTFTTKYQLGKMDELLSKNGFMRIQKSFIVAINKIESYTSSDITINGKEISIGRIYKELVLSVLGKK